MKIISFILINTVVFGMLCSCQYDSFKNKKDGKDSDSLAIHIAVLPTEECNPFYAAQECGIYDSLGVDVKLDTFLSAMDADTAFMKGKVHILVSDSLKAIYLNSIIKGDSIRSVITDTLRLSLMTSTSSRIKSVKNLKEKIVAVTRNSAIDCFADRIMDRAKIKREYLNRPQINKIELRAKMLNLNQYDGAILPEPYATQCEEKGAKRIAKSDEPLMRVLIKNSVYKTKKKDINKIIEAYSIAKHAK